MLEIACFSIESALVAAQHGADRIEFCHDASLGGITPHLQDFQEVKQQVNIPVYVMIRPRGGNFVYTEKELEQMSHQLQEFKKQGADGFVFGILTSDNQIDILRNSLLVQLASPLPCTFHRAFDLTIAPQSLEKVIECGFTTLLTSGSLTHVLDGKDNLARLVELASNRIKIVCGGGLRSSNIKEIKKHTKATCFHSSAILNSTIADAKEIQRLKKEITI